MEQLVEVPTVLSYSLLQQRTAVQIIDIAVPRRGGGARGGLQGLSQGQGSTAVCGAENVDTPIPHGRGRLGGRGHHGLSQGQAQQRFVEQNTLTLLFLTVEIFTASPQGQGSTALCGADHVDIPVPHGRVGREVFTVFPRTGFHSVCR